MPFMNISCPRCAEVSDLDAMTHRPVSGWLPPGQFQCPHSPKPLDKALELIADLARGMELWAADEDGIHAEAWKAYRKAKALEGVLLPEDEP